MRRYDLLLGSSPNMLETFLTSHPEKGTGFLDLLATTGGETGNGMHLEFSVNNTSDTPGFGVGSYIRIYNLTNKLQQRLNHSFYATGSENLPRMYSTLFAGYDGTLPLESESVVGTYGIVLTGQIIKIENMIYGTNSVTTLYFAPAVSSASSQAELDTFLKSRETRLGAQVYKPPKSVTKIVTVYNPSTGKVEEKEETVAFADKTKFIAGWLFGRPNLTTSLSSHELKLNVINALALLATSSEREIERWRNANPSATTIPPITKIVLDRAPYMDFVKMEGDKSTQNLFINIYQLENTLDSLGRYAWQPRAFSFTTLHELLNILDIQYGVKKTEIYGKDQKILLDIETRLASKDRIKIDVKFIPHEAILVTPVSDVIGQWNVITKLRTDILVASNVEFSYPNLDYAALSQNQAGNAYVSFYNAYSNQQATPVRMRGVVTAVKINGSYRGGSHNSWNSQYTIVVPQGIVKQGE